MNRLFILPLLFGLGCPSEPVDTKDDTGPVDHRVDGDRDGYFDDEDCDDADPAVHPGAAEVCNEVDDDCDTEVDEGVQETSYADEDGDGYGDPDQTIQACGTPDGYVPWGNDCDDGDAGVNPAAPEVCNGIDDNCDEEIDEGFLSQWYADGDGDGYGDPAVFQLVCEGDPPAGMVPDDSDCDDTEPAVNPAATEVCNDVDDDCDGDTDEPDAADASRWHADDDGDGHGDLADWTMACERPDGYVPVAAADDCDDTDPEVHPDATEICNGVDDDCDGGTDEPDAADATRWYEDDDGDTYGNAAVSTVACSAPAGFVARAGDCDDLSATTYPGADEYCDDEDDDCDGTTDEADALDAATWYYDGDSDGYGATRPTTVACDRPARYAATSTDCDDADASIHPGATEVCDTVDEDCDGTADDGALGTAEDCPAEDCVAVLADDPAAPDGSYYMDDGYWWECDMTTDGGGWLEVSTAVQVWGTGYDTQYHNTAGFRWSEALFRYSSGSSTAGCTYPTAIPSSNPLTFQFGSEIWGLPDNTCGSTCGWAMLDYASATTYLTTAYDFVIARAESTDTIRVGMLEGMLSCTTSDNWGYAWVDILIRR